MVDRFRRGFTVVVLGGGKDKAYIGTEAPNKRRSTARPYTSSRGMSVFVNERIRIHEDGRDFLGPFPVKKGEALQVHVETQARWGVDCYVVGDLDAKGELASYVSPATSPNRDRTPLLASGAVRSWDRTVRASEDTRLWVILDNTDEGDAAPPSNMIDDVLDADVYVATMKRSGR